MQLIITYPTAAPSTVVHAFPFMKAFNPEALKVDTNILIIQI